MDEIQPFHQNGVTLATVEQAKIMLAQVSAVDVAKDIRDKAEALRQYMKQAGDGLQAQNYAAEIKLRAERRGGELLRELERAPGARTDVQPHSTMEQGSEYRAALTDNNIAPVTAHRWQAIASIPEDQFDEVISGTLASDEYAELTTNLMLRKAQEIKRQRRSDGLSAAPVPSAKYRVFYADPPWQYGNAGVINESDSYGRAERHYPVMSIAELCEMGTQVKGVSEQDAVLFLWVTSPLLAECMPVITAWGFQYKTSFVWDKVGHNFGHYNSVRHEFLLVCTRGSCTPDTPTLYDSVVSIEKSRKHSEKPEEFRQMIDALYTHGKRIELFARTTVDGWDSWGNETV